MVFVEKFFHELTAKEVYEILKVRSKVFMLEQEIHCLDMDDMDYESLHVFAQEEGRVVAYLRAYATSPDGDVRIGRVLTVHRGEGMGKKIMEKGMDAIRRKMNGKRIFVDAQLHAKGFYEKCGFVTVSEEFLEEGILHVKMERKQNGQKSYFDFN